MSDFDETNAILTQKGIENLPSRSFFMNYTFLPNFNKKK
jgi:hypothetical protein